MRLIYLYYKFTKDWSVLYVLFTSSVQNQLLHLFYAILLHTESLTWTKQFEGLVHEFPSWTG